MSSTAIQWDAQPDTSALQNPRRSLRSRSTSSAFESNSVGLCAGHFTSSAEESFGSRVWQGVRQSALGQLWDMAVAPPQNSIEGHIAMIAGPQALTAYRAAEIR